MRIRRVSHCARDRDRARWGPFFVMGDLRHVRARDIEYFQGIPSDHDREIPHDREIQKIRAVVQLYDHFRDSYGE